MIILHSVLSGFEGSKKITSVLNKHFHKPSSKCQNAYAAMWEIKVIYFLANSILCIPLPLSSHIFFFLCVLPAFSVLDGRFSIPKYPHHSTSINSVTMWTLLESKHRKPELKCSFPMCFIIRYNQKSGHGQFQGLLIKSQQCHQAPKFFLMLIVTYWQFPEHIRKGHLSSLHLVKEAPQLRH